MSTTDAKVTSRLRRKRSIRKRLSGTGQRPRLSVYRSSKHIYAQVVDDVTGTTLVSASTQSPELKESLVGKKKSEHATLVGQLIAKKSLEQEISKVVFDRNGFIYHGRIKAVADGAREAGLQF
jgi:large subunit ribosomal protein L18